VSSCKRKLVKSIDNVFQTGYNSGQFIIMNMTEQEICFAQPPIDERCGTDDVHATGEHTAVLQRVFSPGTRGN
jgi:hypothetical protein